MSERTFGVEIECGHDRGYEHVRSALRTGPHPAWARDVGADGSGVEVRSPVLQGNDGFKQIHDVMGYLVKEGCYVTIRDGMHVHHGCPDFANDRPTIAKLLRSWYQNQHVIDNFVAPYRRTTNHQSLYNRGWTEDQIKVFEENQTNTHWGQKARTINVRPLVSPKRTVEIRQFGGNLDPEIAEAWIRFCQKFIDSVVRRRRPLAQCSDTDTLLRRVKTPKTAATTLLLTQPVNPPRARPVNIAVPEVAQDLPPANVAAAAMQFVQFNVPAAIQGGPPW